MTTKRVTNGHSFPRAHQLLSPRRHHRRGRRHHAGAARRATRRVRCLVGGKPEPRQELRRDDRRPPALRSADSRPHPRGAPAPPRQLADRNLRGLPRCRDQQPHSGHGRRPDRREREVPSLQDQRQAARRQHRGEVAPGFPLHAAQQRRSGDRPAGAGRCRRDQRPADRRARLAAGRPGRAVARRRFHRRRRRERSRRPGPTARRPSP